MNNYKFEINQQVVVRPDFTSSDADGAGYVRQMEELRGQIVTIKSRFYKSYERYRLKEDKYGIAWTGNQLEPIKISENELLKQFIMGQIDEKTYKQNLQYVTKNKEGVKHNV